MKGHLDRSRASAILALPMVLLLVVPMLALVFSTSWGELTAAVQHPLFASALLLSLRTSIVSAALIVVAGTPLAWWLSGRETRTRRAIETLVDAPIVIPPAVMGIALLLVFGREGVLGGPLAAIGWSIPFTSAAVVIAQTVVAAPFYVQAATDAFGRIDPDLLLVARTLGHKPPSVLRRVVIPMAMPGLVGGLALSWARALGEFGATLLFAGNLMGTTQTMPLAIYAALESDVRIAVALSLCLAAAGLGLLMLLRLSPTRSRA